MARQTKLEGQRERTKEVRGVDVVISTEQVDEASYSVIAWRKGTDTNLIDQHIKAVSAGYAVEQAIPLIEGALSGIAPEKKARRTRANKAAAN